MKLKYIFIIPLYIMLILLIFTAFSQLTIMVTLLPDFVGFPEIYAITGLMMYISFAFASIIALFIFIIGKLEEWGV